MSDQLSTVRQKVVHHFLETGDQDESVAEMRDALDIHPDKIHPVIRDLVRWGWVSVAATRPPRYRVKDGASRQALQDYADQLRCPLPASSSTLTRWRAWRVAGAIWKLHQTGQGVTRHATSHSSDCAGISNDAVQRHFAIFLDRGWLKVTNRARDYRESVHAVTELGKESFPKLLQEPPENPYTS